MQYKIPRHFSKSQRKEILEILDNFHKTNQSIENENKRIRADNALKEFKKDYEKTLRMAPATEVIRELEQKGLYYDKNSIYYDVRRTGATFNASTTEKRLKAQQWFDEYFEPLRKQKKINSKQAYRIWERAKMQSYDNMTKAELEFALELREMGSP